eukprot:91395-Rhodomonas_salina.6
MESDARCALGCRKYTSALIRIQSCARSCGHERLSVGGSRVRVGPMAFLDGPEILPALGQNHLDFMQHF